MCRKQLQVIFGHKANKPFKSYIPRGEIICSQKDASAFIGRVVVFFKIIHLANFFTLSHDAVLCKRGARFLY